MKDMRDEAELKKIEKLFEEALNEVSKDPDRIDQVRRQEDSMLKPWEKAVEIWKKNVDKYNKNKSKTATLDDHKALRDFKAAVQDKQAETVDSMDFSSPEALKKYLDAHPKADPGKHKVTTPGERADKRERAQENNKIKQREEKYRNEKLKADPDWTPWDD